jgi:hypothetical protein
MRCCRWLNNEQALEDSANFMRNVKFENINENLTARKAPWIYYGVRVPSPAFCGGGHPVVNAVFCRGHMQEHGRLTCVSCILISCLVLLRRVVRTFYFQSFFTNDTKPPPAP